MHSPCVMVNWHLSSTQFKKVNTFDEDSSLSYQSVNTEDLSGLHRRIRRGVLSLFAAHSASRHQRVGKG